MNTIPAVAVTPHPMSFVDPEARLFTWNGDLYRGIHRSRATLYERLFDDGVIADLVGTGMLVETERTPLTLEPFSLVLKHRQVPFVSYPFEWSPRMLRDAALLVLDLERELLRRGLTLQDAHSWNVLWDGPRPVFVDFSSIVPFEGGTWNATEEFRAFFLRPLRFMAAGHTRIARQLMQDVDFGIGPQEASLLDASAGALHPTITRAGNAAKRAIPESLRPSLRRARALLRGSRRASVPSAEATVAVLREEVMALAFENRATDWSSYYDGEFPAFTSAERWTVKHRAIDQILTQVSPRTVLDLGANRGWFARLAGRHGAAVLAADADDACVDLLYDDLCGGGEGVQAAVMDVLRPWQGAGVNASYAPSAVERFRGEMVLALALTHHLVFKRHATFEQLAAMLAGFTGRTLVVEFVPPEDYFVRQWMTERHGWYTLDNFVAALRRHLPRIGVQPSWPEPRVLVVAER